MSIGNLKDQGNKGNNFPYQLAVLKLLDQIVANTGATSTMDRELRVTTYQAIVAGAGYSIGDIISRTDIINVATGAIISTLWFNETTGLTIAAVPITDIVPYSPPATVTLPSVVRTPTFTRYTNTSGTVAAGARSVTIANTGNASATVLGSTLKRGEVITFSAGAQSDTLTAIAWSALGANNELIITVIV
jgi:hypothetical protein